MRSTYIDTETMVVVEGREFNKVMRKKMAIYKNQALVVVDENKSLPPDGHEPLKVQPIKRIKMVFAGILRSLSAFFCSISGRL